MNRSVIAPSWSDAALGHSASVAHLAPDIAANALLWSETWPGGTHASWLLSRGTALRFIALAPGANCSVVLYARPQLLERYNMPDTLKAQHTAHVTRGHTLMSEMGRAMASVIEDSVGWHDPLGGLLDTARMQQQYGVCDYGQARNAMHRSGRDGLLIEIAKAGLSARDLIAPLNLFSKVTVDDQGRFQFVAGHAPINASVTLRCDMDLLVAMSAAPHALDPASVYAPAPIGVLAYRVGPAASDDVCRQHSAESYRAHHNTDRLVAS